MILIQATPHDIESDTSLTPEEKRVLLKMLPPKITLTIRNQGIVNESFEWDKTG